MKNQEAELYATVSVLFSLQLQLQRRLMRLRRPTEVLFIVDLQNFEIAIDIELGK